MLCIYKFSKRKSVFMLKKLIYIQCQYANVLCAMAVKGEWSIQKLKN